MLLTNTRSCQSHLDIHTLCYFFSATVVVDRMNILRNLYQRLHRQAKSGSEPIGKTVRQREVLRLVPFLRRHISTNEHLTCYKRLSPRGKSTPRREKKNEVCVVTVYHINT